MENTLCKRICGKLLLLILLFSTTAEAKGGGYGMGSLGQAGSSYSYSEMVQATAAEAAKAVEAAQAAEAAKAAQAAQAAKAASNPFRDALSQNTVVWVANKETNIYAIGGDRKNDWTKVGGGALKVSVSPIGTAWVIGHKNDLFFRTGMTATQAYSEANSWRKVESPEMNSISVGLNGVWGVTLAGEVLRRTGITPATPEGTAWKKIAFDDKAKDLSVGVSSIWATAQDDRIFIRTGVSVENFEGSGWEQIEGGLKQLSVGPNSVWGVNSNNDVYVREGITAANPKGTSWRQITGYKCTNVAVGHRGQGGGEVWAITDKQEIIYRTGTFFNIYGTGWRQVPGAAVHVSVGGFVPLEVTRPADRGKPLRYGSLVTFRNTKHPEKLLWTHGDGRDITINTGEVGDYSKGRSKSRDEVKAPNNHAEILIGPSSDDRASSGPEFFIVRNAKNPLDRGVVNYKDPLEIVSVCGGKGRDADSGVYKDGRTWWVNDKNRWGDDPYSEIVVSVPEHVETKSGNQIFTFVSCNEFNGPVCENDVLYLISKGKGKRNNQIVWAHEASRWGPIYCEIILDDHWGRNWTLGRLIVQYAVITDKNRQVADALTKAIEIAVNMPEGFEPETGWLSNIAVGSDEKGNVLVYGVSGDSATLYLFNASSAKKNPWDVVEAKDDKGAEIEALSDVSISSDKTLVILDDDGVAYRYDFDKKYFVALDPGKGNEKLRFDSISASSSKDIWTVDTAGNIHEYTKDGWQVRTKDVNAIAVSAGLDGTIVFLRDDGVPFMLKDVKDGEASWTKLEGVSLDQISVGDKDTIVGSDDGKLYRYQKGVWRPIDGKDGKPTSGCSKIVTNATGGSVWALTFKGDPFVYGMKGVQIKKEEPKVEGEKPKLTATKSKEEAPREDAKKSGQVKVTKKDQEESRVEAKKEAVAKSKKVSKKKKGKRKKLLRKKRARRVKGRKEFRRKLVRKKAKGKAARKTAKKKTAKRVAPKKKIQKVVKKTTPKAKPAKKVEAPEAAESKAVKEPVAAKDESAKEETKEKAKEETKKE